jgi:hypothetical protein
VGLLVALYYTAFLFGQMLDCVPPELEWNPKLPGGGRCIDLNLFLFVTAILNMVFDATTLALPIPVVWRLKMPWTKKLAVSGVFLLGGL